MYLIISYLMKNFNAITKYVIFSTYFEIILMLKMINIIYNIIKKTLCLYIIGAYYNVTINIYGK